LGIGADAAAAHTSLRIERSFQDPLVAEIAFAIVSEMRTRTAGSRLLAETLAVSWQRGWCIVMGVSPPTKIWSSSLTRDLIDAD
jgi:hypothetical protein